MTDFRKAGAEILRIIQSTTDPTAEAGRVIAYGKLSGGVTKLFVRDGGGTISEIGGGPSMGGPITGATAGSALFVGAGGILQQDNANFFWDDTNNRLGIGTAGAPAFPLDVKGLLGNTPAKFGTDWPIALVSGTAFSIFPSVGFACYYNGGWRFADGPLFNYAGYQEFRPDTTVWNFYRSNQGLGANTLFSSSTLQFQITASNSIRAPGLGVFSPGGNWRGFPLTTGDGTFVLDMASNDLVWDTNTKRLCLGTNPDWATATISIRKAFALQIQCRNTSAASATSGGTIHVSNEPNPTAAGHRLGGINFGSVWSFDIVTPFYGAFIEAFSEASWTASTSYPTYLSLKTTPSGGVNPLERMRVTADGGIQVPNGGTAVSEANTGRLRYNSTTQTFQVSLNGAAYTDLTTAAPFTLDIGDAVGSSTVGSILFVGAGNVLQQDNANLFWDDTNNRLGIGTASPARILHIEGTLGGGGSVFALRNLSSAGTSSIDFYDDVNNLRINLGHVNGGGGRNRLYSDTHDLHFENGTRTNVIIGHIADAAFVELAQGSSAAVSAASTGRIRYNTTGQVFQISKNTVAYENVASLATAQTFTKSQNVAAVALTDAANIATDASLGNVFTVTLAGNRTLDNPTNLVAGGVYRWIVTQDATGSRTLAYGTAFKWPGGTAPTLTTAANAIDTIEATYNGSVLLATFALNFS